MFLLRCDDPRWIVLCLYGKVEMIILFSAKAMLEKRKSQRWGPAGLLYIFWSSGDFDFCSAPLIYTWLLQALSGDFSS